MIRGSSHAVARARLGRIDGWLILSALTLLTVGLMSLYSIDQGSENSRHLFKQGLRLVIGAVPFAIFFFVRPDFLRRYASVLYGINIGLLLLVLVAGSRGGGAQRWLDLGPIDFQPSEMSKVLTVITLAAFFANRKEDADRLSTFLLSILHVSVPMVLIFLQPHFGAALVMLVAWLGVCIAAKVKMRFLVGAVGVAAVLVGSALLIPGLLKPYQVERIMAMFGGSEQDTRFQIARAEMAFAAGGATGAGYLKGEFKAPGFVPAQHTDFIFTVIGEEGGLIGCSLVLATYAFFFFRTWRVAHLADEPFHRMIAAGLTTVLAFHTIVNLGMNLGLLPVVGLWLPFLSYGGTAIWMCLSSVALLLNIERRTRPILF